MLQNIKQSQKIISWGHWFAFFNGCFAVLFASRYAHAMGTPETWIGWLYLIANGISHFIFLAFCLYIILLLPISMILTHARLIRALGALIATLSLSILWFDIQVFKSYGIHLSPFSFDLALNSTEHWLKLGKFLTGFLVVLIIEFSVANIIWKRLERFKQHNIRYACIAGVSFLFVFTHVLHIFADFHQIKSVVYQDKMFPLSYPTTARTLMNEHGFKSQKQSFLSNHSSLKYPLENLNCAAQKHPNILMVTVQGWRASLVDQTTMPWLSSYKKNQTNFSQHFSGGADFNTGIFSIIYGLQGSYIDAIDFESVKPSMSYELKKQGYQLHLFHHLEKKSYPSSTFTNFEQHTINSSKNQAINDTKLVNKFIQWKNTNKEPWFSTLILENTNNYDTPIGFKGIPSIEPDALLSTEERVLFNQYRQSLYALDKQLKKVITSTPENTIIIITGSHGKLFSSKSSSFSPQALQVPLIIHDPSLASHNINYTTHHNDIVPTLMTRYLKCSNINKKYSSGYTLFKEHPNRWFYSGSPKQFVIYFDQTISVIQDDGNYKIYNKQYQLQKDARLPYNAMLKAMHESQRFYD